MKLQLLNEVLRTSAGRDMISHYKGELQSWYDEWNREIESSNASGSHNQEIPLSQLKAWGQLQYYDVLLLLSRSPTSPIISPEGNLQACDNFIQACTVLVRYQATCTQRAGVYDNGIQTSTPFIFPVTWIATHAVFAAGLSLFQKKKSNVAAIESFGKSAVLRRCLTLLAALEANPNNLATGFAEVLERFCSDEEQ